MDIGSLLTSAWEKYSKNLGMCIVIYLVGMLLGGMLAIIVIGIPIIIGVWKAMRKAQKGETPDFNDLFSELSNIGKWAMLWVVGLVLALVGWIPLLGQLALIVFAFMAVFTIPLMLERNLGAFDAIKVSFNTVKANAGTVILPVFLLWLIYAVSAMILGIGALFTGPLVIIALWQLYDQTTIAA